GRVERRHGASRRGASPDEPGSAGGGRVRARAGAVPALRTEGGVPRPQSERKLPRAPTRSRGGRGAPPVRAALLQRCSATIQRCRPTRARPAGRTALRVPERRVLSSAGRRACPRAGTALVRAARASLGARLIRPSARAMIGALVLLLLAPLAWAQPGERILDYDIEIDIRPDGSLLVAEHIT